MFLFWGLLGLALVGHVALWMTFVNHVHATAAPCWSVRILTALGYSLLVFAALAAGWWGLEQTSEASRNTAWSELPVSLRFYAIAAWSIAVTLVPWRLASRALAPEPAVLREQKATFADLTSSQAEDPSPNPRAVALPTRMVLAIPGNQALRLEINHKTLELARLPDPLAGLKIAHFSDIHFTGRIGKPYFCAAIERLNEFDADFVCLTGDLIEKTDCLAWIPATLGKVQARRGRYFVLGNHDIRIDTKSIRSALVDQGWIDVGGRWVTSQVDSASIVWAGNELPWIVPAADLRDAPNGRGNARPLKILLSHSPDQIHWARARDFDLMLAGHTHGGQVQAPWLGPVVAPSRHGVKYASGVFSKPPLVMHVSRGLSSELPLRMWCLPEISRLTLVGPPEEHPSERQPSEQHPSEQRA